MKILTAFFLSLVSFSLHSQLGFNFRYGQMNPELWEEQASRTDIYNSNLDFGIDYWFRLKEYRLEFAPEIYYSTSSSNDNEHNFSKQDFGIAFNTNFYIFDFIGDCDCPTFSKDGNFFSKGFFLSIAPLYELQNRKVVAVEGEQELKVNYSNFGLSLGAGVDIGLTDLVTLTPYVRYKLVPRSKWEGLGEYFDSNLADDPFLNRYLQFGIRIGLRPDYIREQNKYRFRR